MKAMGVKLGAQNELLSYLLLVNQALMMFTYVYICLPILAKQSWSEVSMLREFQMHCFRAAAIHQTRKGPMEIQQMNLCVRVLIFHPAL
jgi:hypothetical protein